MTSSTLPKFEKHPYSWTFTSTPPLDIACVTLICSFLWPIFSSCFARISPTVCPNFTHCLPEFGGAAAPPAPPPHTPMVSIKGETRCAIMMLYTSVSIKGETRCAIMMLYTSVSIKGETRCAIMMLYTSVSIMGETRCAIMMLYTSVSIKGETRCVH